MIGPLADSQRDTLGPWVLRLRPRRDRDRARRASGPGRRRRAGRLRAAASGPCSACSRRCSTCSAATRRRTRTASTTRPSSSAPSTLARDADVAVVVVGEWQNMIGEAASRSSLELPGPPARAAAGGRRDRHAGRAAGHERAAARPALGGRARAGDPRHLVPGHPGRRGRGEPAVRRRLARRQAALHLAAHGRAGADGLLAHPISHEPENQGRRYWDEASTPLFPFGHGLELRPLRVRRPHRRPLDGRPRRDRHRVGRGHQHRRDREADEVVQLYIHQRHGSASRPVRELKGFERITLAAGESRTVAVPARAGRAALLERRGARLGDSTRRPSTSGSATRPLRSRCPQPPDADRWTWPAIGHL